VAKKPLVLAFALAFCVDAKAQDAYVALSVLPSAAALATAAPALPFRYIGRLRADGRTEVLLMRGSALYSVAPGAHIDADYRVERITDSTITFTYLPLRVQQDMGL
jgi:hypothetical protein